MSRPDRILAIGVNYNNAIEIGDFLSELFQFHPMEDTVIVDDGSTDGSADVAKKTGARVLRHGRNRGIGAAIRTGIKFALEHRNIYDAVVILSCNGKMRPADLSTILAPLREGRADYVQGSRFHSGGTHPGIPLFRRLAIPVFSLIARLVLRRKFSDLTCGFRAYHLSLFDDPAVDIDASWLDHYEMEYYIHIWACRKNLRIVEVPVTVRYDHLNPGRISKIVPLIGWWSMVRPFIFMGLGLKK